MLHICSYDADGERASNYHKTQLMDSTNSSARDTRKEQVMLKEPKGLSILLPKGRQTTEDTILTHRIVAQHGMAWHGMAQQLCHSYLRSPELDAWVCVSRPSTNGAEEPSLAHTLVLSRFLPLTNLSLYPMLPHRRTSGKTSGSTLQSTVFHCQDSATIPQKIMLSHQTQGSLCVPISVITAA